MKVRRHRGMMTNEHIMTGSLSYEKCKAFKYLGSLSTNLNSIHEEMKCRLKAGNLSYYSVQILSSAQHLAKNLKIKINNNITTFLL